MKHVSITAIVLVLSALAGCATTGDRLVYPSRDEVCSDMGNHFKCSKSIEESMTKLSAGKWVRDGYVLKLWLDDGTVVTRRDNTPEDFYGGYRNKKGTVNKAYTIVGFSRDYYILEVQMFEDVNYEMISRKTGEVFVEQSMPEFSPDRRHFMLNDFEPYEGCMNGVEIWMLTPQKPDKVFAYYPNTLSPCFADSENPVMSRAVWVDNDSVLIYRKAAGNQVLNLDYDNGSMEIREEKPGQGRGN